MDKCKTIKRNLSITIEYNCPVKGKTQMVRLVNPEVGYYPYFEGEYTETITIEKCKSCGESHTFDTGRIH